MIELSDICKRYFIGMPNELEVLHGVSVSVKDGEFVSIVGESGSGKSTLMNIIGALDRPTEGGYLLGGVDVGALTQNELSQLRKKEIGFVFQTFNLVGRITARANVEMPMTYARTSKRERAERAEHLLGLVGMGDRQKHKPNELSGGQKQRVAIARAMANDPDIILADEPTGALDSETGKMVMAIFRDLNKNHGKTIVLVTHSLTLAAQTDRIITLKDGVVVGERAGGAAEEMEGAGL
ncbi:MAG: ABC transporter ATP-binding protein [Clostridiales Family XIII bacterium]|nr:ABC transporter ATP-binding protein [Clostridiales Family XIII bacterium]